LIKLEPNIKSLIKNWSPFLKLILIFAVVIIWFYYQNELKGLFIFYIFILIQFLFTAYLSVRYYYLNKGEIFTISNDGITKVKNNISNTYETDDIKKIVICKSANMDARGIPYTTFEEFRLARVYLKNGNNFTMTNILEHDIEQPLSILKDVQFERRKGFSFFI
jgi:hypothetical protein